MNRGMTDKKTKKPRALTVRLDPEDARKLAREALLRDLSIDQLLRRLVRRFIASPPTGPLSDAP